MFAAWRTMLVIAVLAGGPLRLSGTVQWHDVTAGQSLTSLGARFGVEASTLASDNGLRSGAPIEPGLFLLVDNRHIVPTTAQDGVVINVPQRMLFVLRDGRLLGSFPIAVGRADWPTPIGRFQVRTKETDPTWDVPESIQQEMAAAGKQVVLKVAPGPANPLGSHYLGLTANSVGIHGTNVPTSIYRFTTHGCIRLHPDDAAALFALVEVGTSVEIIYEPVLVTRLVSGEVLVEVHRDPYKRGSTTVAAVERLLAEAGAGELVGSDDVKRIVKARTGRASLVPSQMSGRANETP